MNSSFKLDLQLLILYWTFLKLAPPLFQKGRSFSIKYLVRSFIPLQSPKFDTVAISIFFCDRLRQLKPSVGISFYHSTGNLPVLGPFSLGKKYWLGKLLNFLSINDCICIIFPLHFTTAFIYWKTTTWHFRQWEAFMSKQNKKILGLPS